MGILARGLDEGGDGGHCGVGVEAGAEEGSSEYALSRVQKCARKTLEHLVERMRGWGAGRGNKKLLLLLRRHPSVDCTYIHIFFTTALTVAFEGLRFEANAT